MTYFNQAKFTVCCYGVFLDYYYSENSLRAAPLTLSTLGLAAGLAASFFSLMEFYKENRKVRDEELIPLRERVSVSLGEVETATPDRSRLKTLKIFLFIVVMGCAVANFTMSFFDPGNPDWMSGYNDCWHGINPLAPKNTSVPLVGS